MKTFILISVIAASLFANTAQAIVPKSISCPNITEKKRSGKTITVNNLTWEVKVTPDSDTSKIVNWQDFSDQKYKYMLHIGRPVCSYITSDMLDEITSLYLVTNEVYMCGSYIPNSKYECTTNSFILKE